MTCVCSVYRENLRKRKNFEEPGVDETMILKRIIMK
jgi:hypothetical protein